MKKIFILSIFIALLSGCTTLPQEILNQNTAVNQDSAVILVTLKGKRKVNYLQYCHSSLPCLNYRFSPRSNDVLAFVMKAGMKGVYLGSLTYSDSMVLMLPYGVETGYTNPDNKPINLDHPGVYYDLTLNTDTGKVSYHPPASSLRKAKRKYGSMLRGLKPINFKW